MFSIIVGSIFVHTIRTYEEEEKNEYSSTLKVLRLNKRYGNNGSKTSPSQVSMHMARFISE